MSELFGFLWVLDPELLERGKNLLTILGVGLVFCYLGWLAAPEIDGPVCCGKKTTPHTWICGGCSTVHSTACHKFAKRVKGRLG